MSTTPSRTLTAATALFRRWRSTRDRGERIPPNLWSAACAAAREHGVSRTSLALGLDYYSLKRRVDEVPRRALGSACDAQVSPGAAAPGFVELPVHAPSTGSAVACTIVLEQLRGDSTSSRLRIELPAIAAADLAALVERWGLRP